jgi:hypothetical protein
MLLLLANSNIVSPLFQQCTTVAKIYTNNGLGSLCCDTELRSHSCNNVLQLSPQTRTERHERTYKVLLAPLRTAVCHVSSPNNFLHTHVSLSYIKVAFEITLCSSHLNLFLIFLQKWFQINQLNLLCFSYILFKMYKHNHFVYSYIILPK